MQKASGLFLFEFLSDNEGRESVSAFVILQTAFQLSGTRYFAMHESPVFETVHNKGQRAKS